MCLLILPLFGCFLGSGCVTQSSTKMITVIVELFLWRIGVQLCLRRFHKVMQYKQFPDLALDVLPFFIRCM
jgi:hypothetical protein